MGITVDLGELLLRLEDLAAIENEMVEYEKKVSNTPMRGGMEMHSGILRLMETMDKSKMFFEDQNKIIREISPPAAAEIDDILKEYKKVRSVIEKDYKKASRKKAKPEEIIEILDEHVSELVGYYNRLRTTARFAYNCFAGVVNFTQLNRPQPKNIGWRRNTG